MSRGCTVESCGSGEEALRIFQDKPGAFACVVTDFEMLAMDGLELGGRLRAMDPEVKMVLITGNPGALAGIDIRRHGFDCMLAKPFTLATIRECAKPRNFASIRRFPPPATMPDVSLRGRHIVF